MTYIDDDSHVFIVRIWGEPREIEGAATQWRGMIEHVSSGERRYLKELDDIATFATPYLAQLGMKLPLYWRVKMWLRRRKLF